MPLVRRLTPLAALLFMAAPAGAQELGTYREFRDWMAACDNTCNQDDEERDAPSIDRLGPGQLLVGVRCWRGAYNFSRAYYLVDEGPQPNVRPASFTRPAAPAPGQERDAAEADNVLVNAAYVAETGSIDHYSKGRGIGDCGELGGWVWDGRAFQSTRLTLMPACRGILPSHWFSLYRTQEGRAP